jgi:CRP/FNR family transcriptional regulator
VIEKAGSAREAEAAEGRPGGESRGSSVAPKYPLECVMPPSAYHLHRPELSGSLRRGEISFRQAMGGVRFYARGATILPAGEEQDLIYRLRSGWVCRSRTLADGRRQILGVSVPGDLLGLAPIVFARSLDRLTCLTRASVEVVDQAQLWDRTANDPDLARFLLFQLAEAQRRQDSWLIGLGRCTAEELLAAMLLDARERLRARSLLTKGAFRLPLTQQDIADYLGMTSVHVSRVLGRLRRSGTITIERRVILLHDIAALRRTAAPMADLWAGEGTFLQ